MKASLNAIYWSPTGYCNLKCSHCWINPPYSSVRINDPQELNMSEIRQFIKDSHNARVNVIKLTGGEPFLRPDIHEIIRLIHNYSIGLQIETNAVLIGKETAKLLSGIKKNDGKFFISVSLDGGEKTHDSRRGVPGSYKQAVLGIENLLSNDIHPQIIFSLSNDNKHELENVIETGKAFRARSIKINFVNTIERARTLEKKSGRPDVQEILNINNNIGELSKKYQILLISNIPPAFKKIRSFAGQGRCGVLGIMGVLPDGGISLCGIGCSVPDLIAGNVKNGSLRKIWETAEIFLQLRKDVPRRLQGVCGICILKSFCMGHCRAEAYYRSGSFTAPFSLCQDAYELGIFPEKWLLRTKR